MDRILLLNLPRASSGQYLRREECCWGVSDQIQLPMHLANISGALKGKQVKVELIDANRDNLGYADLRNVLQKGRYDAVVCAITVSHEHQESEIARICKEADVKCIAIACPFGYAEDFAAKYDFHFTIYSEPERVIADLVDGVKREDLRGIVYKNEGKIVKTEPSPLTFKDLPSPDWDLFDPVKYETIQYQFARGCPYRCAFCVWGTERWQLKPVDMVLDDLDALEARGVQVVVLLGAQVTSNKKWLDQFCSEKKRRGNKISFAAPIRASEIDRNTITKLKEAGCYAALAGVESAIQRVLDDIGKKETVEQSRDMIRMCKEEGLPLAVFLMFGLGERDEEVDEYVKFIRETKPEWMECGLTKVYKGTLLHQRGYSYDIDKANRRYRAVYVSYQLYRELEMAEE